MNKIVWLSLDPVHCKIDFYPVNVAQQLEAAYHDGAQKCCLGSQFFNATVHFGTQDPEDSFHQTTPGQHFGGRYGFKPPGFRSVARIVKEEDKVTVPAKCVFGEWRISKDETAADSVLAVVVPVEDENEVIPSVATPRVWSAVDCSATPQSPMIVWQWCKDTDKDMKNLSEEDWLP